MYCRARRMVLRIGAASSYRDGASAGPDRRVDHEIDLPALERREEQVARSLAHGLDLVGDDEHIRADRGQGLVDHSSRYFPHAGLIRDIAGRRDWARTRP